MIMLENNNQIPPKEWLHDPDIKNYNDWSLGEILYDKGFILENDILIPNCQTEIHD